MYLNLPFFNARLDLFLVDNFSHQLLMQLYYNN